MLILYGEVQNVQTLHTNTLLTGGKSPWYSKGHAKCKQGTWSVTTVYSARNLGHDEKHENKASTLFTENTCSTSVCVWRAGGGGGVGHWSNSLQPPSYSKKSP